MNKTPSCRSLSPYNARPCVAEQENPAISYGVTSWESRERGILCYLRDEWKRGRGNRKEEEGQELNGWMDGLSGMSIRDEMRCGFLAGEKNTRFKVMHGIARMGDARVNPCIHRFLLPL